MTSLPSNRSRYKLGPEATLTIYIKLKPGGGRIVRGRET